MSRARGGAAVRRRHSTRPFATAQAERHRPRVPGEPGLQRRGIYDRWPLRCVLQNGFEIFPARRSQDGKWDDKLRVRSLFSTSHIDEKRAVKTSFARKAMSGESQGCRCVSPT